MKREATRIARNPRHSLARPLSMLALVSAVSVAFSLYFHDAGTAIVGDLGAALVLLAVGMWYSARQVRRSVSELHDSGCVAWPVAAQSDRDSRLRLGILGVDGSGLVLILKSESIRLDWSDVTDVTLQSGGFLRAGRPALGADERNTDFGHPRPKRSSQCCRFRTGGMRHVAEGAPSGEPVRISPELLRAGE